jgi:Tol biopolymer transport system component
MSWSRDQGDPAPREGRMEPRGMVAPAIAAVLLVVAALLSLNLLALGGNARPGPGAPGASGEPGEPIDRGDGGTRPTPNPSTVITPPPDDRAEVTGTLLFTRTGNIWAASGTALRQLSNKGTDSAPMWAPDGESIYFLESRTKKTRSPYQGRLASYTLVHQVLMRMAADGSGREVVRNPLFQVGGGEWFTWLLQPDISPDGRTFALASDGEDGSGDVVLSTMGVDGGRIRELGVRNPRGLGHSDPDWSPDGTRIAFTYNNRSGSDGAPRVGILSVADRRLTLLRGQGYANPSWFPDGSLVAAERTTGRGRDVVVVDAVGSGEVLRLTQDGRSFAPEVSPDGRHIAYLRLEGLGVDLRIATIDRDSAGNLTLVDDAAITDDGSLDPSPPAWWLPPSERPTITPAPVPSSVPSTSPAP